MAKSFYDIIMDPALSVTLNDRTVYSAAEMLTLMQIYFLTNPAADHRQVPMKNYYESILKPWLDHLGENNVRYFFLKTNFDRCHKLLLYGIKSTS